MFDSEYNQNNTDPDTLSSLAVGLKLDMTFVSNILSLSDQMHALSPGEYAVHALYRKYTLPHFVTSINSVANKILQDFYDVCSENKIDVNNHKGNTDAKTIVHNMSANMFDLQKRIKTNDIVSATNPVILYPSEGVYEGSIIKSNIRLIGRYLTISVGAMPDSSNLLNTNDSQILPLGIGLKLDNCLLLDRKGASYSNKLSEKEVILVLGTLGMDLSKITYP